MRKARGEGLARAQPGSSKLQRGKEREKEREKKRARAHMQIESKVFVFPLDTFTLSTYPSYFQESLIINIGTLSTYPCSHCDLFFLYQHFIKKRMMLMMKWTGMIWTKLNLLPGKEDGRH
jgi:hypothetical protein